MQIKRESIFSEVLILLLGYAILKLQIVLYLSSASESKKFQSGKPSL